MGVPAPSAISAMGYGPSNRKKGHDSREQTICEVVP